MTLADPDHIRQLASRLVAGPATPDRLFGLPGISFGALYARAVGLRAALAKNRGPAGSETAPVCLCTTDHTVAAAALLASLAGGPPLVMPYAHSETVLAELHQLTQFNRAIVDDAYPLPRDTRLIAANELAPGEEKLGSEPPLEPDAPWVHLFTGGSTGTPRLWTKTVRNLLGESAYLAEAFAVSTEDRILTTSPPYHIYGLLYAVLVPFLAGAGIITATPAFPGELTTAIEDQQPTILVTVPVYYRALSVHLPGKSDLRIAFSSASPLTDEDADAFSTATGVPIHDVYGSTETGGIASRCRAAGETGYTPFACVDLKIQNERLRARSPFLSPQLKADHRGYVETADRVAKGKDGTFTVIGRLDGVIKVGGKRVDLAEIRARLLKIKDVRDALVVARPTVAGRGNEILAIVETDLPGAVISRTLDTTFEPYARPRAIRVVSKMPVTGTGKYDREAVARLF